MRRGLCICFYIYSMLASIAVMLSCSDDLPRNRIEVAIKSYLELAGEVSTKPFAGQKWATEVSKIEFIHVESVRIKKSKRLYPNDWPKKNGSEGLLEPQYLVRATVNGKVKTEGKPTYVLDDKEGKSIAAIAIGSERDVDQDIWFRIWPDLPDGHEEAKSENIREWKVTVVSNPNSPFDAASDDSMAIAEPKLEVLLSYDLTSDDLDVIDHILGKPSKFAVLPFHDPETKESFLLMASKDSSGIKVMGIGYTRTEKNYFAPMNNSEIAMFIGVSKFLKFLKSDRVCILATPLKMEVKDLELLRSQLRFNSMSPLFARSEVSLMLPRTNLSELNTSLVTDIGVDALSYPIPDSQSLVDEILTNSFSFNLDNDISKSKFLSKITSLFGKVFDPSIPHSRDIDEGLVSEVLTRPGEGLLNVGRNDRVWLVTSAGAGILEGRSAFRLLSYLDSYYGYDFRNDILTQRHLNNLAILEGATWVFAPCLVFCVVMGIVIHQLRRGRRADSKIPPRS